MEIQIGDLVAGSALLLSAFATWKSVQFNELQKKVISQQEQINKLQIERVNESIVLAKQAELGANIVKLGNMKYKLKIFNKGQAVATNVRINLPVENDIIPQSFIDDKFPLEMLDVHQSVEVWANPSLGSQSKVKLDLVWNDEISQNRTKSVVVTI